MSTSQQFLCIEPIFFYDETSPEICFHVQYMKQIFLSCIQKNNSELPEHLYIERLLKIPCHIAWDTPQTAPALLSIICVCNASSQKTIEEHLPSLIQSRLIPGKYLSLTAINTLSFRVVNLHDEPFFTIEIKCLIETERALSKALHQLPLFSEQMIANIKSPSNLQSLIVQQTIPEGVKYASVHNYLCLLIRKFPLEFDLSLLTEMTRFFSLSSRPFFEPRSVKSITRIITYHFLMKHDILRRLALYPETKQVCQKIIPSQLKFRFGSKFVLGICITIGPLEKDEFFEEIHILQAVNVFISDVQAVQGSFYIYRSAQDPICTLYIEIEKKSGGKFDQKEILQLKEELEEQLKKRIERLVPSIFMIRNEEETMRNILILSQELKYISDIPQVMISLDRHTSTDLVFTVILVRLLNLQSSPLTAKFSHIKGDFKFHLDRQQEVGFLRKHHIKEANVFHLQIPKDSSLLRADRSINFYLARHKAATYITKAVGSFRDYNGGMILKQGELLYQFKQSFSEIGIKNSDLLENFFFSLYPIEIQATLPLQSLCLLFSLFLDAQKDALPCFLKKTQDNLLFVVVRTHDATFKEEIIQSLSKQGLWSKSLIRFFFHFHESFYSGFVFSHHEMKKQILFQNTINSTLSSWMDQITNRQIVRLSVSHIPSSFDPRMDFDELSCTLTRTLFEGLCRFDEDGCPRLASAETFQIENDGKRYVFKLRKSYWSDGSLVSAYDFEYSWKKILDPRFVTPFAYLFYPIKNAKLAKEGLCSTDLIAVTATDSETLTVDLEYQESDFLERTALPFYAPVHHQIDQIHPDWGLRSSHDFICNGPFILKRSKSLSRCDLVKNPLYWDALKVGLNQISLVKNSSRIARSMFLKGQIDLLGMPIRPWEPFFGEANLRSSCMGVHWAVFNVERYPFQNVSLRKAFDLAINRTLLVTHFPDSCKAANSPLPPCSSTEIHSQRLSGDEQQAIELFERSLKELKISRKQFPPITLLFSDSILKETTALYLVDRWKQLFKIPCRAEKFEHSIFSHKIVHGDFQIAIVYWKPWIDHLIYTLEIFTHKDHTVNPSRWSSKLYCHLIELSKKKESYEEKLDFLLKAERLLVENAPIIALYYEQEIALCQTNLKNLTYCRTSGALDFKHAYVAKEETLPAIF